MHPLVMYENILLNIQVGSQIGISTMIRDPIVTMLSGNMKPICLFSPAMPGCFSPPTPRDSPSQYQNMRPIRILPPHTQCINLSTFLLSVSELNDIIGGKHGNFPVPQPSLTTWPPQSMSGRPGQYCRLSIC